MDSAALLKTLLPQLDAPGQALLTVVMEMFEMMRQQNEAQQAQLAKLTAQIAEFQRMLFGSRSERSGIGEGRVEPVANEVRRAATAGEVKRIAARLAEESHGGTPTSQDVAKAIRVRGRQQSEPQRATQRAKRRELPIIHTPCAVTAEQLPAGMALDDFVALGTGEVVVRYERVRAHFVAVHYRLQKMQHREDPSLIIEAQAPQSPVEGGHYSASVYAWIVILRCLDSMPLHRIARAAARDGLEIAPSSVGMLFHRAAFLLQGVYDALCSTMQAAALVHADETPQPVLAPAKALRGWIWVACCANAIVYRFSMARDGKTAELLLGSGTGTLMADGYSAYNVTAQLGDDDLRDRAACWSHARRLFWRQREDWPEVQVLLDHIRDLYRIEHRAVERALEPGERRTLRQLESKPLLDRIQAWIATQQGLFSPSSKHGEALRYVSRRWAELTLFVNNGLIPLDNNIAERALRIVALGRNNSMFVGPGDNGQDLAILLSITHTCQLLGIDVTEYLVDVLPRLAHGKAADAASLLPAAWAAERSKAIAAPA